ncbi:MAG: hypothetical protein PHS96_00780 [Anaerolineales bacterium]|nr:hypothetical protein [Anaerolineales bacterium]
MTRPPLLLLSLSDPLTTAIRGKPAYDLPGVIDLAQRLWEERLVDGFEFELLAEWDAEAPPHFASPERQRAWEQAPKYSLTELGAHLKESGLPLRSLLARRDLGRYLGSQGAETAGRGRSLIAAALSLGQLLGVSVCVFYLWDPSGLNFNPSFLQLTLQELASRAPGVRAAVEAIPSQMRGFTPYRLARRFDWVSLDAHTALAYNELPDFRAMRQQVANVRLRAHLQDGRWRLPGAAGEAAQFLRALRADWAYEGLVTLEPASLQGGWRALSNAMRALKRSGIDAEETNV